MFRVNSAFKVNRNILKLRQRLSTIYGQRDTFLAPNRNNLTVPDREKRQNRCAQIGAFQFSVDCQNEHREHYAYIDCLKRFAISRRSFEDCYGFFLNGRVVLLRVDSVKSGAGYHSEQ